jgi:hypothetical protein
MEEQEAILLRETPDVEHEEAVQDNGYEEESEISESEFEVLTAKVDNLAAMMEQFFPLLQSLTLQKPNEKKKSQKFKSPETPKKYPWERDPTFTELAGSMAYSPKDFKRRETIFDQAENIENHAQAPSYRKTIPQFKGELKSTRLSEVTRFFKDLNSYQSENHTSERGAPHLAFVSLRICWLRGSCLNWDST